MVERCPDKTEVDGPIPSTLTMKIFIQISSWIVGPLIFALYLGQYFDSKYNTEPKILIIACIIAFILTIVAITKISKNYIKSLKESNDRGK